MTENCLVKLFEHNNWANHKIIQACYVLSDEQLDAEPHSVPKGNIRETLTYLVAAQPGYLALLTFGLPPQDKGSVLHGALGCHGSDHQPCDRTPRADQEHAQRAGLTPSEIDGWDYGEATNTLVPITTDQSNPGGNL